MKIIHGVSQAEACLKTRLPVNIEFHVNRFISLFVNSTFLSWEEWAQRLLIVYLRLRNYEKQFKDLGIWYEHRLIDDMVS